MLSAMCCFLKVYLAVNQVLLQASENCIGNVGDETHVCCYDPESNHQSSQWENMLCPCPENMRQVRSNIKSMLMIFFDCESTVNQECVLPSQTEPTLLTGFATSERMLRKISGIMRVPGLVYSV
jgi:hypothetical protein